MPLDRAKSRKAGTLGAIASNEAAINARTGKYAVKRKPDAVSYQGQAALNAIQGQRRKANVSPGGSGNGSLPPGVGQVSPAKMVARLKRQRETASLKGGLTMGTTMHSHDGTQERRDSKGLTYGSAAETQTSGTSIFDPVLCELAYRWFCPPGGTVLDPFAGGSVRGIVASVLGRPYVGIDLSERQIAANRVQAAAICRDPLPQWIVGDARHVRTLAADTEADFIMACPPYADLERYSDDPADLSTLAYAEFRAAYRIIIAETCALLKPDRFACFVVGDVRDSKGFYYGFPWHTVEAFEAVGLRLYNEAVLVTMVGSLPIRAGKQFAATRKLGRTHQNVLCFVKGDPRVATRAIGECDFGDGGPGSTEETTEVNEQPSGSDDEYGERL